MKGKDINLKNKIITLLQNTRDKVLPALEKFKNRITPTVLKIKDKTSAVIANNKKSVIIIGLIIIILMLIVILACCRKTKIGNTNSNLENLGFVIKNNKSTYYLGFDNNEADGIYKIKGNKKEKILDGNVMYFNKIGKDIYYLDLNEESFVRISKEGKNKDTIIEKLDIAKTMIVDDWIYYFEEAKLYKIKTNGKNKQIVLDKIIEDYEISKEWVYYSYKNDGKYIISKTDGEENIEIDADAGKNFFIKDKNIYYIAEKYESEKNEYKYELYKMKINGKNKEKVMDLDKRINVNKLNINEDEIYYLKSEEDGQIAIYKMDLKNKEEIKIVNINGYATYINVIDDWIYYPEQDEEGNTQMFRIKIDGKDKEKLSL